MLISLHFTIIRRIISTQQQAKVLPGKYVPCPWRHWGAPALATDNSA